MGCTHYAAGLPSDEEQGNFRDNMGRVQMGMPEADLLTMFPVLRKNETRKIGIINIDQYEEADYFSRTYWIGYIYADGVAQTVTRNHIVSVDCINGAVHSIFWP